MKANELRIGNTLKYYKSDDTFNVTVHDIGIIHTFEGKENCPEPIPLTEEWLVKFGFWKEQTTTGEIFGIYVKGRIDIEEVTSKGDEWELCVSGGVRTGAKLKYVHQLQNLYFALTGEELTINERRAQ